MTSRTTEPARVLGRRLRELRKTRFPGATVTERELGRALGGDKPVSAPLISSWEIGRSIPAKQWVIAYATFFSTSRSVEGTSFRLLSEDDLGPSETDQREALLRELLSLRANALRVWKAASALSATTALTGPWQFGDGMPIRIVCGTIPEAQLTPDATPTHPTLSYGVLYSFGNIDALFELHGHIRAANPYSDVRVLRHWELEPDDLASHLVILGGVDWNPLATRIPQLVQNFTVRQVSDGENPRNAYYEVEGGDEVTRHGPVLSDDGELIWDVGLFARTLSPFNRKCTFTTCSGTYSLGTWAVVRALTDVGFRERNEEYLSERFPGQDTFSILMRILVLNGYEAVTPDWTNLANRLYEWPE